jgi:hypothetical protein
MITMTDIRKFGKDITINGKTVETVIDQLIDCGVQAGFNKNSQRKFLLKVIPNGTYGSELAIAFKHIETMKSLNVLA